MVLSLYLVLPKSQTIFPAPEKCSGRLGKAVAGQKTQRENSRVTDRSPSVFREVISVLKFLGDALPILNYLCTLAPAPPMMASTSFLLAMVVSPGVVMARAPWAAP